MLIKMERLPQVLGPPPLNWPLRFELGHRYLIRRDMPVAGQDSGSVARALTAALALSKFGHRETPPPSAPFDLGTAAGLDKGQGRGFL